jgi:hypothetical protein
VSIERIYADSNLADAILVTDASFFHPAESIPTAFRYNLGDADESRADGYMSAYQQVLSKCPWMPVVGK